jgi:hypothetical protein
MRLLCLMLCWLLSVPVMAADTMDNVPRFVSFPVIIVNTSDGQRYNGLFSVKVQLLVNSPDAHDRAEALRPQYQDALTQATYRLAQLYVDPRKPVPWTRMEQELNTAVRRVSGNAPIKVLIVEAATRPTN